MSLSLITAYHGTASLNVASLPRELDLSAVYLRSIFKTSEVLRIHYICRFEKLVPHALAQDPVVVGYYETAFLKFIQCLVD